MITLSLLGLLACSTPLPLPLGTPTPPSETPTPSVPTAHAPARRLFAELAGVSLSGRIADPVLEPPPPQVLLALDGAPVAWTPSRPLAADPHQDGAYTLTGDGAGPLALYHPEQIPVDARRSYRLRYRVQTLDVPDHRDCEEAVVRVLHRDGSGRARVLPAAWVQGKHDSSPWTERSTTFRVPETVTDVQLQLVATTPKSADDACPAVGEVAFDDLVLEELFDGPFASSRTGAHPRLGRVTLSHLDLSKAQDTRKAVHAPAPSRLTFTLDVPARAVLDLGMGLLAESGPAAGAVRFSVAVRGPDGPRELHAHVVAAGTPAWLDARIDLGAYAGQRVELELITEAHALAGLPDRFEAADLAVWSEPVLHSEDGAGKVVVLVVVDTLGAWATGEGTPQLTRLGAHGLVRTAAYSSSSWTLPAIASMLTGQTPAEHGAGAQSPGGRSGRAALPETATTVVERLSQAGWQTRAWINNPFLAADFGLAQGFDRYVDIHTRHTPGEGVPAVDAVVSWLSSPSSSDRFALLHLMEPHGPYRPTDAALEAIGREDLRATYPKGMSGETFKRLIREHTAEPLREEVRALYTAAVWDADRLIGQLYDALADAVPPERLRLVLTADHGEELWQHGTYEHGHAMHDEVIRVPWITVPATPAVDPTPISTRQVHDELLDLGLPPGPVLGSSTLYGPQRAFVRTDQHVLVVNAALTGSGRSPPTPALASLQRADDRSHELIGRVSPPSALDAAALAAWSEGHARLLPELLHALAGHHLLIVPPTAPSSWQQVELSASLPDRSWPEHERILVWPGTDGSVGQVDVSREVGDRVVRAYLSGTAAVFALAPPEGEHVASWTLHTGGASTTFTSDPAAPLTAQAALIALTTAGGPPLAAFLAPSSALDAPVDASTAEQLRGLGYVE
jgi:hypothetical protein